MAPRAHWGGGSAGRSGVGPHSELIAARVGEMEAASAGEIEWFHGHGSARIAYRGDGGFQVVGIQQHQRPTGGNGAGGESTRFTRSAVEAADSGVHRAVVVELPAECGGVEALGRCEVGDGEFDVVDAVVDVCAGIGHGGSIHLGCDKRIDTVERACWPGMSSRYARRRAAFRS